MKSYFKFSSDKGLLESTEYLLNHTEDDGLLYNSNKYSFILVSAASLESLLNEGIICWAHKLFSSGDYKRHATAFLSMNLGKKLDALGFLLSSGKFITDNTSQTYQALAGLIKLRNAVAHSKDFYKEVDIELGPLEDDGGRSFRLPYDISNYLESHPLSLNQENCKLIFNSLKHLEGILNEEISYHESELFKTL